MTEEQFLEVTCWQKETFPKATALSKTHHLKQEVDELIDDLETGKKDRRLEFADCFLLLFGAAESDGMSYRRHLQLHRRKAADMQRKKMGRT